MATVKRIPQRKCVGCGISKDKSDLIRIVRSPENEISIDLLGKKSGRGAYICKSGDCLKKAVKSKKFDRHLNIKIPDELTESLIEQLTTP